MSFKSNRGWYIERGKNAGKNKKEGWEYPAKIRKLGKTVKVKKYVRKDGIKVRAYYRKSLRRVL